MHGPSDKACLSFNFNSSSNSVSKTFHNDELFLASQDISLNCTEVVPGKLFLTLSLPGRQAFQMHRKLLNLHSGLEFDDVSKTVLDMCKQFNRSCCIL